jgi:hypothetical protein
MNRYSILFSVMTFAASLTMGANLPATQVSSTEQTANQPAPAVKATPATVAPSAIVKGTTLVAEFSHGLNSKKLKAGDKVKAVLVQDLVLKGQIAAPAESKLVGHITEVKASTDADPESHLGVVFDKVLLKHHHDFAIQAEVQALLAPAVRRSKVDEPDQMMPPMVLAQGNPNSARGNAGSRASNSGTGGSSVAALNSIGATPTVQNTPGSSVTPIDLSKTTSRKLNASNGMRGVYGIKNITLGPASSHPTLIVSKTSNVKLEDGTQVILVLFNNATDISADAKMP